MHDLIDLQELRTAAPPPPEQRLSPERVAVRRRELRREIARLAATDEKRKPRRFRRRVLVLGFVAALSLGGAVAYSLTIGRSADHLGNGVMCYQSADPGSAAARGPFTGQNLASFCAEQWSSGSITSPPPGAAPKEWVACENDAGVAVFPSSDQGLCAKLGLPALPAGYYEAVGRYSQTEADLAGRFPENSCTTEQDAVSVARSVLSDHGYTNWTVHTRGFGPLTPCALTPELDPVNGGATIIGTVRPELAAAVRRGLESADYCGPESSLLNAVNGQLEQAGFGDWHARLDHELSQQWPCVAGYDLETSTKTILLVGRATG